jgi:dGTPase
MIQNIVDFKGSLSSKAFISQNSLGRRFDNDIDLVYKFLDPFFLDREKIRLSKSYRRLANKTQVFPPDLHSNVRNRLIHTNDVVNLASLFANILGLNIYLAEAIAYGHDIGHTPFGHLGERLIRDMSGKKFAHHVMSVVVAQKIERKGLGLNLSYETLEGILNHSRGAGEMDINRGVTEESNLVMYSDKIAYTFSDLNDAIRVGCINESKLPKIIKHFGKTQRERILKASFEFIKESSEEGIISFSKSGTARKFSELRSWMYENVYFTLDVEDYRVKIYNDLKQIAIFILDYYKGKINPYLTIGCMTDSEVRKFSVEMNNGRIEFGNYGFIEIISNLLDKEINIFEPDLHKKDFCF